MAYYNLQTLLHRTFSWTMTLPNGQTQSGNSVRNIPVRIPKIQRDYAEGRETESIERKRHSLLNDILDVVYGLRPSLSFDFIYGYMRSNGKNLSGNEWQNTQLHPNIAFEPLDGQQRLTTLFLLYWLFGRSADLCDNHHSLFIYETRDTSEEFCHWLVNQQADTLISEWEAKRKEIKSFNTQQKEKWNSAKDANGLVDPITNRLRFPLLPIPSLFVYMQALNTFKWDWHDDPNIRSMIKVLETTVHYLHERGLDYASGIEANARLDDITFLLLDNLDCDGDQLFEKMNARGKALTSFEILKSTLEEEMEQQGLPTSHDKLANDWRNAIDGNWIDYCWDNSMIGPSPKLENVREVEKKLEKLLIRIAGKSFFATNIEGTQANNTTVKDYTSLFENSISGRGSVNKVIDRYVEYARYERSLENTKFSKMDFQSIYNDMQNLLYEDSKGWHDASYLLPQLNRANTSTLMDMYMIDSPTHNTRVMIYAMLAYLRIAPSQVIDKDTTEKANFIDWMRFIRNVYNSDNKNSGLDNFNDVRTSIDAIDNWLTEYETNYRTNNKQDILLLIKDYIKNNAYSQEQARLDEEAIKAELRINGTNGVPASAWEESILKAENNFYLWGQIIAPLSWSFKKQSYDKTAFDEYVDRLNQIFFNPLPEEGPVDALLIQAMLCLQDYRHNLRNHLGSLGRLNNNRDFSWKQYLRRLDPSTKCYGRLFKEMIDLWLQPTNTHRSFEDLLREIIKTNKTKYSVSDWQYYIVNIDNPKTLINIFNFVRTNGRYVYMAPGGHAYYFRSNTFRTVYRYELLTTYLAYEKRLLTNGVTSTCLTSTADELGAHADFIMPNGNLIRLTASDGDLYNIEQQNNGTQTPILLHSNININNVETELINLGVISSL